MKRRIVVKLDRICGANMYYGRAATIDKKKIPSIEEFDKKVEFITTVAHECPFSPLVIERVEKRIDELNTHIIGLIRVLENKKYSTARKYCVLDIEYEETEIDVSNHHSITLKLINTLILYDEFNRQSIRNYYLSFGKLRLYQLKVNKIRNKIRACMEIVLGYVDQGIRSTVNETEHKRKIYTEMVKKYGEPKHKKSAKRLVY